MYLPLETYDVWHVDGKITPKLFLESLKWITTPADILTIGTYAADAQIFAELETLALSIVSPTPKPYVDWGFDDNRIEYPNGRAFDLPINEEVITSLRRFCDVPNGGIEKSLFFDHVLAYRPGVPLLPLIYFHDAFSGGELYLSGHYQQTNIDDFSQSLSVPVKLVKNPDHYIEPVENRDSS